MSINRFSQLPSDYVDKVFFSAYVLKTFERAKDFLFDVTIFAHVIKIPRYAVEFLT